MRSAILMYGRRVTSIATDVTGVRAAVAASIVSTVVQTYRLNNVPVAPCDAKNVCMCTFGLSLWNLSTSRRAAKCVAGHLTGSAAAVKLAVRNASYVLMAAQ